MHNSVNKGYHQLEFMVLFIPTSQKQFYIDDMDHNIEFMVPLNRRIQNH